MSRSLNDQTNLTKELDDVDALCELVSELAAVVERALRDRPVFAPGEIAEAESIVRRARLLHRKRTNHEQSPTKEN